MTCSCASFDLCNEAVGLWNDAAAEYILAAESERWLGYAKTRQAFQAHTGRPLPWRLSPYRGRY